MGLGVLACYPSTDALCRLIPWSALTAGSPAMSGLAAVVLSLLAGGSPDVRAVKDQRRGGNGGPESRHHRKRAWQSFLMLDNGPSDVSSDTRSPSLQFVGRRVRGRCRLDGLE